MSTFLSLHYHVVFSTKNRLPLIEDSWRIRFHAFLGGVVSQLGGVPESVGGVSDHVHLLMGLRATHRLSDIMRDIKSTSSRWVREVLLLPSFGWQDGYAAFTVSPSSRESVRPYIENQEAHHRAWSFADEMNELERRASA